MITLTLHQVVRGVMPLRMECAPAFNYARSEHKLEIIMDQSIPLTEPCSPSKVVPDDPACNPHMKALFKSPDANLDIDLRFVPESSFENIPVPSITLELLDLTEKGHKGMSACSEFELVEGQAVTFVLRTPPTHAYPKEAKPSREKAEMLGVSFESKLCPLSLGSETDVSPKNWL